MREESLKNKAYKYIKDKIINCEYEPGRFLDERELVQEINASRTPIREALNKIEQEKLIQILPKKGVIVTAVTLKNVVDVYQIREILEPNAISNHFESISKEKMKYFREMSKKQSSDYANAFNEDNEFHTYLVGCYENDYINHLMEEIIIQNQCIRILTSKLENYTDTSIDEHLKIIGYILNDEKELAAEAMRELISLSKKRTMKTMQKM